MAAPTLTLVAYVVPANPSVIPAKAGIQRARQRSAHGAEGRKGCVRGSCLRRNLASLGSAAPINDNCPLPHRRANPYIGLRRSRADGNLASPAPCLGVGAVREPPERHATSNVPPNQRQLPLAPSPRQPLHWSPSCPRIPSSFPCRREPRIPAPMFGCRGGSRTARTSRHLKRTAPTNDNWPLRHSPTDCYIGPRRSREGGKVDSHLKCNT